MSTQLPDHIQQLLEKRYLLDNETTWEDVCKRVATQLYLDKSQDYKDLYDALEKRILLPNSPTLMNAGTEHFMGSACFFLPLEDSIDGIFKCIRDMAQISKAGGGIGINLTPLRPEGAPISTTQGTSSGPISFLEIFDTTIGQLKQGGRRRGAAIAIMSINHPDIVKFIKCKTQENAINNFNISVEMTDEFMRSLQDDYYHKNYKATNQIHLASFYHGNTREDFVISKHDGSAINVKNLECSFPEGLDLENHKLKPGDYYTVQDIWDLICERAHANGDPGLIFMDQIHRKNGQEIQGVNACQPNWAPVLTPQGIRLFQDIEIGDVIWSGKQWTKIINKSYAGKKEVYAFHTSAGTFYGTQDHNIISHDRRVEANIATSIDVNKANTPPPQNLAAQDIMDGLVLGNGMVHKASDNLVLLYIGQNDQDYFDSEIRKLILKESKANRTGWKVKTTIDDSELPRTFLRKIPDRFFYGDPYKVRGFLRGLYSANGDVIKSQGRVILKASSFDVVDRAQQMLSSIGITSYYTINKAKKDTFPNGTYQMKQSYDLNITTDRDIFYHTIGFLQNYKMENLKAFIDRPVSKYAYSKTKKTYKIRSQELVDTCDVWDITVDAPEHTYWTGGLLVSNCGELPLEPYEACVLGSIDVSKLQKGTSLDWNALSHYVSVGVKMLNRIIDEQAVPLPEINEIVKRNRKIGLGIMGFADLLLKLGIRYGSQQSLTVANTLMAAVTEGAQRCSQTHEFKNKECTCIAPTGSLSLLAECSSGIEPNFRWTTRHHRNDLGNWVLQHPLAQKALKDHGELPDYFVTADQITPEEHVKMQAAFQRHTDNSISKTVNLPKDATVEDIKDVYELAHTLKCKGITVYRDGSRKMQVLNAAEDKETPETITSMPPRPYKLSGYTYRIQIDTLNGIENMYAVINELGNQPYEVFLVGDVKAMDRVMAEYIDSTTRLVSLSMRAGVPVEKLIEQLEKVSATYMYSIPLKLANILREHTTRCQQCPDCGGQTEFAEGCLKCTSCGWSQCS